MSTAVAGALVGCGVAKKRKNPSKTRGGPQGVSEREKGKNMRRFGDGAAEELGAVSAERVAPKGEGTWEFPKNGEKTRVRKEKKPPECF